MAQHTYRGNIKLYSLKFLYSLCTNHRSVLSLHVADGIWDPCPAVRMHCTPHMQPALCPPVAGVEISVWCGAWAPLRSTFVVSRLSAPKFHPEIACCSIFISIKMFHIFHQNRQVLFISGPCMSARLYEGFYRLEALIDDASPQGSKLTPAPYEKAQTSEEMMYMQAVRSYYRRNAHIICSSLPT